MYVIAVILPPNPSGTTTDFASTNSTQILDDAVTYSDIFVTNTLPIVSVNAGIEVQDPRISDLVFHLISPDGTRILLMENRGGADTNGAGVSVVVYKRDRNRKHGHRYQQPGGGRGGGIHHRP